MQSAHVPLLHARRYAREKLRSARVIVDLLPMPSVLNILPSVETTVIVNVCIQLTSFERTGISKKCSALSYVLRTVMSLFSATQGVGSTGVVR